MVGRGWNLFSVFSFRGSLESAPHMHDSGGSQRFGKNLNAEFGAPLPQFLLSQTMLFLLIFQLLRLHQVIQTVGFCLSFRYPVCQEQELEKKVLKKARIHQVPISPFKGWLSANCCLLLGILQCFLIIVLAILYRVYGCYLQDWCREC